MNETAFRPLIRAAAIVAAVAALVWPVTVPAADHPDLFTLTSPDFADNGMLSTPNAGTGTSVRGDWACRGENVSPALAWSHAPAGTKSFAVIMDDPDAAQGRGGNHWTAYDIAPTVTSLPRDAGNLHSTLLVNGNNGRINGYGGPCAEPDAKTHHFLWMVFALDIPVGTLKPGLTRAQFMQQIEGHNLAEASLVSVWEPRANPDPLPDWNEGPAKKAILDFVHATTDAASPKYVPPSQRIATFDQDGTTWVEQPMYTEVVFSLARIAAMAPAHPAWKTTQPFAAVLAHDRAAMAKFSMADLEKIIAVTHTGVSVDAFAATVKAWLAAAKDPRWKRPYTELVYAPMLEVMRLLRANGYRTYIVTGGGQEFVRAYAEAVYGVPPQWVIGTAADTQYGYAKNGSPILMKSPKVLLNDNFSGKPEDIYLFTGSKPQAAFGNSTGDQQMLEYAGATKGASLEMIVLHDDKVREYAYGPATGLPASKVGTFTQKLYNQAQAKGWNVISMKRDWKRIFGFTP